MHEFLIDEVVHPVEFRLHTLGELVQPAADDVLDRGWPAGCHGGGLDRGRIDLSLRGGSGDQLPVRARIYVAGSKWPRDRRSRGEGSQQAK